MMSLIMSCDTRCIVCCHLTLMIFETGQTYKIYLFIIHTHVTTTSNNKVEEFLFSEEVHGEWIMVKWAMGLVA